MSHKNFYLPFLLGMLIFVSAVSTGCTSTRQFVPLPDQDVALENPNAVRIYVLRPTVFGGAVKMKVFDNGKSIGETLGGGYLSWEREPGDAMIESRAENTSHVLLNTEVGETYYVQQHVSMGLVMARNHLEELDHEEGKKLLKKCKPPKLAKSKDEKVTV